MCVCAFVCVCVRTRACVRVGGFVCVCVVWGKGLQMNHAICAVWVKVHTQPLSEIKINTNPHKWPAIHQPMYAQIWQLNNVHNTCTQEQKVN